MKSFAWLSLVAAVVAAQQNNGIPSNASQKCQDFLNSFNKDTKMQACLTPMLTATARFLPSANMQSNKGDVDWAMNQMCTGKSACKESDMQTAVTNMWANCQDELVSGNQHSLETTFELLYLFIPMTNAVCAQDDDKTYCLSKAKKNGGHTKRGDDGQAILQINTDDWKRSHVHYLFMNPDQSADQLCTPCSKQVMTSYIAWENKNPFPMGISSSTLLADQKAIWKSINDKCPPNFPAAILSAANASPVELNNADIQGSTGSRTVISTTGLVGALVALAAALA